jgi:hypothetical protein
MDEGEAKLSVALEEVACSLKYQLAPSRPVKSALELTTSQSLPLNQTDVDPPEEPLPADSYAPEPDHEESVSPT